MADKPYKRPYLDSGVFIAWIKGEVVRERLADGSEVIVERGKIGEHILTLAEQQLFPIIISALTIAEVHKKKGFPRLPDDENGNVLAYFEHDFVNPIPIDRAIGEDANKLCRVHGLSPCDAIHLACAKKAGCDVLLSWDEGLNGVEDPDIRTERPRMLDLEPEPRPHCQITIEEILAGLPEQEAERINEADKPESTELSMGSKAVVESAMVEIDKQEPKIKKAEPEQSPVAAQLPPPASGSQSELPTVEVQTDAKGPVNVKPVGDVGGSKLVVDEKRIELLSTESHGTAPAKPEDNPPLSP